MVIFLLLVSYAGSRAIPEKLPVHVIRPYITSLKHTNMKKNLDSVNTRASWIKKYAPKPAPKPKPKPKKYNSYDDESFIVSDIISGTLPEFVDWVSRPSKNFCSDAYIVGSLRPEIS